MRKRLITFIAATVIATVSSIAPAAAAPSQTAATSASNVQQAQRIMKKFDIPAGPVDGVDGAQTARGLCAYRAMAGLTVSRAKLDTKTLNSLKTADTQYGSLSALPAKKLNGKTTYLLVQKTCQVMIYVENGRYVRIMPASTGMAAKECGNGKRSCETPSVSTYLGYTDRGWHCSSLYPETCTTHSQGRFNNISNHGNMYNRRQVTGAVYVHGSTNVPTYPGSHGCIRVSVADADWMYDNVGNGSKPYISITGRYIAKR